MIDALAAQGVNTAALLEDCGLQPMDIADAGSKVSLEQELALYRLICQNNRDPLLSLKHGRDINVVQCGVLGQAMQSCANLTQAIRYLVRYSKLYSYQMLLDFKPHEQHYLLLMRATPVDKATQQFELESGFVSFKKIFEEILLKPIKLQKIFFTHNLKADAVQAFSDYFQCSIETQAKYNAMLLEDASAREALPFGDKENLAVITALCDKSLRELEQNTSFSWQLQHYLQSVDTPVDMLACAQHFSMSERSLRRRLAAEGQSFQQLLDDYRREKAEQLLLASDYSMEAIAQQLGFAEQRSFRVAFKRWTGITPLQYRQHNKAGRI